MLTVPSTSFAKKLYIDSERNPAAKILVNTLFETADISRFVSKFGSISRTMEYDTGKFGPARHSFVIKNTDEFGAYLFTTRNKLGANSLPGTYYWTDLPYSLYYGFKDAANMSTTGLQDELVYVYQGIVNSKSEDRTKDTVTISSNDIIKKLVETKLNVDGLKVDDVFDPTDATKTSTEEIQTEIRYGKHFLNVAPDQTNTASGCTIGYSATALSVAVWFTSAHQLKQWDIITISNTTNWNGTYVVSSVYNTLIVRLWSATLGANETCTVAWYQWNPDRLSESRPSTCLQGVSIPYEGVRSGTTVGTKHAITDVLQRPGYPNTMWVFTSTVIQTGETPVYYPYFIKNSNELYNRTTNATGDGPWAASVSAFSPLTEGRAITAVANGGGGTIIVTTDTAHGLSNGQSVTIAGTTNYNGTYTITNASGVVFTVTDTYVSSQTGTVTWASLTKTAITFTGSPLPVFNGVTIGAYSASKVLVYCPYPHRLVDGDRVAITGTTNYNGEYLVSDITALTPTTFKITHANSGLAGDINGDMFKSTWPITIYNTLSTVAYKGNCTFYPLTATTGYIDVPYTVNQVSPVNYFMIRNSITLMATPGLSATGDLYVNTLDIGLTWYFPLYNSIIEPVDFDLSAWCNMQFYYWDYIAKIWCLINPLDYNYYRSTTTNGIYITFNKNSVLPQIGTMTNGNQEQKWGTWQQYMTGRGTYFTGSPAPQVCMSFQNVRIMDYETIGFTYQACYANPIAILYDILVNQVGIPSTYLDRGNFKTLLPTTYSWDAAASYFLNSGNWLTGGNTAIAVKSEISGMDLVQELLKVAGIMMLNSFIRSTDKRLRLVINADYVHGTSTIAATYSTNDAITSLIINTDNDKIRDKILISNYAPNPVNLKQLLITKGTGDKTFSISQDDEPQAYWYNSNFWADRCATNYLNKLEDAWEDVEISLDVRGVLVELGDYIQVYDHKVQEYIVMQVYSYSFNFDNSTTKLSGKKVWSSRD